MVHKGLSSNRKTITVTEPCQKREQKSLFLGTNIKCFWSVEKRSCNQAPLLAVYSCRAAPTEPLFPQLKSHANVIYVTNLATSAAHPPPRIFACEDCTVRRRRTEMWGGNWGSVYTRKSHPSVWCKELLGHKELKDACRSASADDDRRVGLGVCVFLTLPWFSVAAHWMDQDTVHVNSLTRDSLIGCKEIKGQVTPSIKLASFITYHVTNSSRRNQFSQGQQHKHQLVILN